MRANYFDNGRQVFSYHTVILERHDGLTIGNVTHYSSTTSKHQAKAGSRYAAVLLDNVPKGATDLLTLAIERGTFHPVVNCDHNYWAFQTQQGENMLLVRGDDNANAS